MTRQWISGMVAALYAVFYLLVVGDIDWVSGWQWQWMTVASPWERLFDMRSLFLFEAVAMVEAGPLVWLFSPLNIIVASVLGLLLALNINLALLQRQEAACRVDGGNHSWLAGAVPALLSGGACCAPGFLLLLGLPGLGAFAALFQWLLPLSAVLLLGNWLWQRHRVAGRLSAAGESVTG